MSVDTTERYIDLFCSMLKSDNLKCTDTRQEILRVFFKNEHIDIEFILKHVKTTRQSVYATINLLLSYNIIAKKIYNNEIFYELIRGNHHYHLICSKCYKHEEFNDSKLVGLVGALANNNDFRVKKIDITIYGLCRLCNNDNQ